MFSDPLTIKHNPTAVRCNNSAVIRPLPRDNYLTLSIVMTIIVIVLGNWLPILCTLPSILISCKAREEERRQNFAAARTKANISLSLNIGAVLLMILIWSAVTLPRMVTISSAVQNSTPSLPNATCYTSTTAIHYCEIWRCSKQDSALPLCMYLFSEYTFSPSSPLNGLGPYYLVQYCHSNVTYFYQLLCP